MLRNDSEKVKPMVNMHSIKTREIKTIKNMPIHKTLKFWEGLKAGKVYGTKCTKCGQLYFPPVADCGKCLSSEIEWVELDTEAEIETFTHVAIRPTSFCGSSPYTVAIGKLKKDQKVLAWLIGFETTKIKIGMKAKLTTKVSPEGTLTYAFVPLT